MNLRGSTVIGTTKDKELFSNQNQEKSSKQEKNVYDLIHSEDLDLLYKKNAHLLARLSRTGKENTQLYSKLSSITKEKSHLGDKNTVLHSKYLGLKEQISVFARQHREFNLQSHKLKRELKSIQNLPLKEDSENFQIKDNFNKQEKEIKLFEKKEQVYKKQIENLQNLYKKATDEKQLELQALQKEQKQKIQALEEKIQTLYQALSRESRKTASYHPSKFNKLKLINQSLNEKSKGLEKVLKKTITDYELALKERKQIVLELNKYKNIIKDKAEELALTVKSLRELEKENHSFKKVKEEQALLKQKYDGLQKDHEEETKTFKSLIKDKAEELALTVKSLQKLEKENHSFKKVKEEQALLKQKYDGLQKDHEEETKTFKSLIKDKAEELALTVKSLRELEKENHSFKKVKEEQALLKQKYDGLQKDHEEETKTFKSLIKDKAEELALTVKSLQKLEKENHSFKKVKEEQALLKQKYDGLQKDHEEETKTFKSLIKDKAEELALTVKSLRELEKENHSFKKVKEEQALLKQKYDGLQKDHEEETKTFKSLIKDKAEELALTVKSLQKLEKEQNSFKKVKEEQALLKQKYDGLQKDHEEETKTFKSLIKDKAEELALTVKSLQKLEKEQNSFKKKEKKLSQLAETLRKEEQLIVQENKKIRAYKKEIQELKKNQEDLLDYKNQISELIKHKEQLKSGFAGQLNLFTKERDTLKFQCESLQKALSSGKLGFDQAMLSFQKKHIKLYQNQKDMQKNSEEKTKRIQALEEKISQYRTQFIQEKEESENQIRRQKDRYISELCGEIKASREHNQDLENQIQKLKAKAGDLFLKEKKQMQEEIKTLRWNQDKSLLHIKESHIKEIENLKSDYEKRIKNLEVSLKKKLQHIRIEMENDLYSEKKRYEVFKNMKFQQIKELQESLALLQKESHELKTKNFVLEKSLEETRKNLDKHLKNSKKQEDQNESLKALWQDLQNQNETKDQQIRSLQKLNRSLSLSLNENKKQEKTLVYSQNKKALFSNQILEIKKDTEEDLQKPSNQILADIHFD